MEKHPTNRELREALDVSRVFAWQVLTGKRGLSDDNLVKAWRLRGWKLGRLAGLSDEVAEEFCRLVEAMQ